MSYDNADTDILSEPYAEWLEHTLRTMTPDKPRHIILAAINEDGTIGFSCFACTTSDLFTLAGAIQGKAIRWLEDDVLEDEDFYEEEDEEGDEHENET